MTTLAQKHMPLLTVADAPRPNQVVIMKDSKDEPRVMTGAINGLAEALIKSGLVKVQASA